jgi:hypothetical protein
MNPSEEFCPFCLHYEQDIDVPIPTQCLECVKGSNWVMPNSGDLIIIEERV